MVDELRKREAQLDEELLAKSQELIDLQALYDERVRRLEAQVLAKEEELKKKEVQYSKAFEFLEFLGVNAYSFLHRFNYT